MDGAWVQRRGERGWGSASPCLVRLSLPRRSRADIKALGHSQCRKVETGAKNVAGNNPPRRIAPAYAWVLRQAQEGRDPLEVGESATTRGLGEASREAGDGDGVGATWS